MRNWKTLAQLTRVHKKFASDYLTGAAEAKADEIIAEHPELEGIRDTLIKQYSGEDETAILGTPLEICEFFSKQGRTAAMEFDTPHTKSVSVTLGTNLQSYRNFKQFLEEETDEDYAALYKKLVDSYEDYFVLASEDMLCDYYGEYREFRDNFIEEENARNKNAAKKRAEAREAK